MREGPLIRKAPWGTPAGRLNTSTGAQSGESDTESTWHRCTLNIGTFHLRRQRGGSGASCLRRTSVVSIARINFINSLTLWSISLASPGDLRRVVRLSLQGSRKGGAGEPAVPPLNPRIISFIFLVIWMFYTFIISSLKLRCNFHLVFT